MRVTLYERSGCGLCDEVRAALSRISRRVDLERVDIDQDPSLVARYTLRVPVLRAGAEELDAAGLDDGAIARWLAEMAGP